jgi:hypothetical protein
MVGLNLLRQVEARAAAGPLARARIELHPEYADALQNSRRQEIARLEGDLGLRIEIIASPSLHRAEQAVEWLEGTPAPDAGRGREAPEPSVRASQLGGTKDEGGEGRGRGQGKSKGRGRGKGRPKEAVEAAAGEEKEAARGGGKGRGRGRGRKRRGPGRGGGAGKGGGGEG